jgi:hypothetical protein
LIQLNPMIPVHTPAGTGFAFLVIDYSQEHFLHFAVALNSTGEIHIFDNREVRFEWNVSLGRVPKVSPPG